MEKKDRSGAWPWAMEGKGFYIVLFLCAAVLGASAWILMNGAGTNVEEQESAEAMANIPQAVVTMIPAGTPMEQPDSEETAAEAEPDPDVPEEETWDEETEEPEDVYTDAAVEYVWPVRGSIDTPYAVETLVYDDTMADWRTHEGLDIACALGDQVIAAADGTVVSVRDDPLYGTTVELDHGSGVRSVYANLASEPPVGEGDRVCMGQVIGSVGGTALAETNQVPHLHLVMTRDGASVDPAEYLPPDYTLR